MILMPTDTDLDFMTPMINHNTGKKILHPTREELKKLSIMPFIVTGIPQVDQPKQYQYEESISDNEESLSKYTLDDAITQLFDVTEMPHNSDFALYNQVLIDIRNAKRDGNTTIQITKTNLDKLKKIFETPPKNPQLNKIIGFVLECLDQAYMNTMIPPDTEIQS